MQLCYAAEKYMMCSLKKKIADRLKPESISDLFPALHCLITYNVNDLEQPVTEVIAGRYSWKVGVGMHTIDENR